MILTAEPSNLEVSARLDEVADLLTARGANGRRVAVYRRSARALRVLPLPVTAILRSEGLDGLIRLPAIGEKMARVVRRLAVTGGLPLLDRLRRERHWLSAGRTRSSGRFCRTR